MFNARHIAAAVLMLAAAAAHAEVYKWTDDKGRVHYGDKPPASTPAGTKKAVELDIPEPSAADRQDAADRAARERARLQPPAEKGVIGGATEAAPAPAAAEEDNSCAAQKRRYEESAACFQQYRNVNGSVKAEAYKHCVPVPQPSCD